MFYCEKCRSVTDRDYCYNCEKGDLREVSAEDHVFLTRCDEHLGEMLSRALDSEGIKCVLSPFGNGVRTAFAMTLGEYKVYVPFKDYGTALAVLSSIIPNDSTAQIRNELLKNEEKWHTKNEKALKKIRKKLKLTEEEDLISVVKKAVMAAEKLSDEGAISSCVHGGHYITLKINGRYVWFNSVTYEIFI